MTRSHFILTLGTACSLLVPIFADAQGDDGLPRLPKPVIVAEKLAGQLVRFDAESDALVDHALDPEVALDHFLLYYSANWSPTCQKFAPALVKFYNEKKASGANFEVIFVSVDDSEAEMKAAMANNKMPWPAVRFGAVQIGPKRELESDEDEEQEQEQVVNPLEFIEQAAGRGVPCVVVMDSRGLILAHSYKRRKEYLGPEKPLEEFAKMLAEAAEKRAGKEPKPEPEPAADPPKGEGE